MGQGKQRYHRLLSALGVGKKMNFSQSRRVCPHTCADQHPRGFSRGPSADLRVLFPVQSSVLQTLVILVSLIQGIFWALPQFPLSVPQPGHLRGTKLRQLWDSPHLFLYLRTTVLCCLILRVLKIITLYILLAWWFFSSVRINTVSVTLP